MSDEDRHLRIPAAVDQIGAACEFVARVARAAGMGEDGVYHCQLSVEEICTNIIEHGYHYNSDRNFIDIVCELHPGRLIIRIFDDAPRFNPLELPDPNPGLPLWEREGGGWGVYFVRKFMNHIAYSYDNSRNQLILEKAIIS